MINIIDSIMGSGKTTYIIQMINSNPNQRYLFIVPYLKEIQRIKMACKGFEEPEESKGELKLDSLNKLIRAGRNIVSTHQLFKSANKETFDALKQWNYTLIIDEALEGILTSEDFKKDDLPTILAAGHAHIDDETNYLIWDNLNYDGVYNQIKRWCLNKSVVVLDQRVLMWVISPGIFHCFSDIYLCTYMFDAQIQRYYFDMQGMAYQCSRVEKSNNQYVLVPRPANYKDDTSNIKINIYTGKKNNIGSVGKAARYKLSSTWYDKATKANLVKMKNNLVGYFKNDLQNSPSNNNLCDVLPENWSTGNVSNRVVLTWTRRE